MYNYNVVIGVLLAITFISSLIFFVVHKTKDLIAQEKILFLLIFLITVLTGVWCIDRVVAFNVNLLTTAESDAIFEIIRTIVTLVLGYYFGTKRGE
jgi:hypothetical protein